MLKLLFTALFQGKQYVWDMIVNNDFQSIQGLSNKKFDAHNLPPFSPLVLH